MVGIPEVVAVLFMAARVAVPVLGLYLLWRINVRLGNLERTLANRERNRG